MIPQDFIQQLLGRVDIVDVIDRHVKLKKAGQNFSACCPFHNEKTPSFSVSPTKQFYHCFGCGAHGTAISFLMEYSGLGFVEAVKELAEGVGLNVPDDGRRERTAEQDQAALSLGDVLNKSLAFYRRELKRSQQAIDYLKGRGLSGEIAAKFGLGYAPDDWQGLRAAVEDYSSAALKDAGLVIDSEEGRRYDRFRGRVMFPILDARGNVIGFGGRVTGVGEPKYLNSPETPLFEKGRELYGLYHARRAIRDLKQVIVVEGYMDVVALAQHGVENAVATLGTATTPVHVEKLLRLADNLVFCFDGDKAGRKAAWRALEVVLPVVADGKSVSFLFLPAEDDPDSFVRSKGADAFLAAAANAKPLSAYLVSELAERNDLKSDEGRVRFLSEAAPLIRQIQAPGLSLLLRKRLAELAGMTSEELLQVIPAERTAPSPGSARHASARRSAPVRTSENRIAALMLNWPRLAANFDVTVGPESSGALRAAAELAAFLRDCDFECSQALILESFRGRPDDAFIAEALASSMTDVVLDEPAAAAEFADCLEKLKSDQRRARRNALAMRAAEGQLTEAESREYRALFS
ncbi:MAG: DNA primase [Betaproteobacteria bacterium]|nr:DNA primase [Betaproteobacteria bacterium]